MRPSESTTRPTRRLRSGLVIAVATAIVGTVMWMAIRPSNDREWIPEQSRPPVAGFDGSVVAIENVRNFDWTTDGDPLARWERRVYDLDTIESVWYVLTPFATDWRGPAHAFLSFGFSDSQYVAVSVEARREVGETYSILKGLLKRFEITYVIGDERDLIGVRTERQHDEVYVYPIRAEPAAVRALFEDMVTRATELAAEPEFYGSLRNNCTTAILSHVNRLDAVHVPYGWRVLVPGYSDELALELGLIDTTLPLDAARERFRINDRARNALRDDDFSSRIRAEPADNPAGPLEG